MKKISKKEMNKVQGGFFSTGGGSLGTWGGSLGNDPRVGGLTGSFL